MTICSKTISLRSLLLTGAAVVACTQIAHAAVGSSGWGVNKMQTNSSAQSYCTVSQTYAGQGTVTLGQTPRNEYSMAFDFTNPVFPATSSQTVTIKTDKVAAQNFTIVPQSTKLAVLNLGASNALWQSFHKGDTLTFTAGGKNYEFKPTQSATGQKNLADCITALNNSLKATDAKPETKQATTTPAANAAPTAVASTTPAVKAAAAPAPVPAAAPVAAPSVPVSNQELAVREENTKLRQALQDSQRQLETLKSSGSSSARSSELNEKVRALEIENAQLKATGNAIQTGAPTDLARAQAEISVLTKQNQDLQRQLSQAPRTVVSAQELNAISKENADLKAKLDMASRTPSQSAALLQERDGLKAQLAQVQQQLAQAQSQKSVPTANDMKLADMQRENADLKARLAATDNKVTGDAAKIAQERDGLKAQLAQANLQLADMQKKSIEVANKNSAQINSQELQKRLAELQTENANLKLQMANAKQPTVTVNPNSKAELESLQAQIASLQAQNSQLQAQAASAPIQSVSTTPAAQNFDLAQANKRYDEAQREIRRLGAIIQAQEQKFKSEKRDIEGMLFDPAIASPAQVAMKESYEQRIADLENQLRSKGISPAASAADPQSVARMVEPASGAVPANDSPLKRMPTGYGMPRSSEPSVASSIIPPITEAEVARDMMPLPPAAYVQPAPVIQQVPVVREVVKEVPVERVVERVVEKTDPKKDAELARISQELEALKANQNQMALENQKLKTEVQQKQVAQTIAAKVPDNGLEISPPVTAPRPIASANFLSARDVTSMLKQSGVALTESVSDMGGATDTYRAFRWKTSGLHGSLEQKVTGSTADYQAAIASYIDRARSRCKGDFAAEPAQVSAALPNAQGYEIACLGGKVDSSASVLFTYSDRVMSTIAHEGKTDLMGDAIAARDNIAPNFTGSVTALR